MVGLVGDFHCIICVVSIVDVFVTSECIHLYILCCVSMYPDVPIGRIINIIKSCKVIEVNPHSLIEGQSPHS